jgi:hypothetical protein
MADHCRCYGERVMSSRCAAQPSRWSQRRWAIAIVAALSLFAAALGCWLLHVDANDGPPQPVTVSLQTLDGGPAHFTDDSEPACHRDLGGSTLNADKTFKTPRLKRDRPQHFLLSAPRSTMASSAAAWADWARHAADTNPGTPPAALAGQGILKQFCVSRR